MPVMFTCSWEMLFFESEDIEVFKADRNKTFWCGCCSLLIVLAKKATKGTELQFLRTQGTLQGGRVDDQ